MLSVTEIYIFKIISRAYLNREKSSLKTPLLEISMTTVKKSISQNTQCEKLKRKQQNRFKLIRSLNM
jgi:hypothetical protein